MYICHVEQNRIEWEQYQEALERAKHGGDGPGGKGWVPMDDWSPDQFDQPWTPDHQQAAAAAVAEAETAGLSPLDW